MAVDPYEATLVSLYNVLEKVDKGKAELQVARDLAEDGQGRDIELAQVRQSGRTLTLAGARLLQLGTILAEIGKQR